MSSSDIEALALTANFSATAFTILVNCLKNNVLSNLLSLRTLCGGLSLSQMRSAFASTISFLNNC